MNDLAKQNILQAKYARIIEVLSEKMDIPIIDAMSLFYNSKTLDLIQNGTADLHCRSDKYLADEIILEVKDQTELKQSF